MDGRRSCRRPLDAGPCGARRQREDPYLVLFALPNFYFHAATAYDILRNKGVPLGKRDFMGQLRMKAA